MGSRFVFALLTATSLAACGLGEPGDEEIGGEEEEVIAGNGMSLNGMSLNGMSLNGMSLNGMSLGGASLTGMTVNGSQLQGTRNGVAVSGAGVVGTTLNGVLTTGATLPIRIDSAQLLAAPNNDVWAYGLSYQSGTSWLPLCGAGVQAVALKGTWNYGASVTNGGAWTTSTTQFTFGCRGAALAKCVELGYKPWKTVGSTLLQNHHLACVRSIRADYCGNGKSYTANGTQINIYDNKGIQADAASWPVDAEWTTTGARCIHSARSWNAGQGTPTCWLAKQLLGCGTFNFGALIIDEYKQ